MTNVVKIVDKKLLKKNEYVRKIVALIVDHFSPEQIYLFGSKARGDAGPDSDYDLLVVVRRKVSWPQRKKFSERRWDAGLMEATDIIFWTENSFKEHLQLKASLPSTVIEEGKLLYAAA